MKIDEDLSADQLHVLSDHVDEILRSIQDRHIRFDEPINYADLNCVEVRVCYGGGGFHVEVSIEEAAPYDCPKFIAHIETELKSLGWDVEYIDILTEW